MSAPGPGCVKTCLGEGCAELFSQLPSSGRSCRYNRLPHRRNRDGSSPRKLGIRVFTQPGSKTEVPPLKYRFRSTPKNGHRETGAAGPFRAKSGIRASRHNSHRNSFGPRTPTPTASPRCKRNLATRLRQNNTTGKSPKTCPALIEKIFRLTCRANQWLESARLTRTRGGSRSSRTCGGMRWTRKLRLTSVTRADGEVVWS